MGGGSLKWGPPLVKRDLDYRFFPRSIYPLKWVCWSEWVCVFVKIDNKWVCWSEWVYGFLRNFLVSFDKFVVFETVVTTHFSLG